MDMNKKITKLLSLVFFLVNIPILFYLRFLLASGVNNSFMVIWFLAIVESIFFESVICHYAKLADMKKHRILFGICFVIHLLLTVGTLIWIAAGDKGTDLWDKGTDLLSPPMKAK